MHRKNSSVTSLHKDHSYGVPALIPQLTFKADAHKSRESERTTFSSHQMGVKLHYGAVNRIDSGRP